MGYIKDFGIFEDSDTDIIFFAVADERLFEIDKGLYWSDIWFRTKDGKLKALYSDKEFVRVGKFYICGDIAVSVNFVGGEFRINLHDAPIHLVDLDW